MASIAEYNRCMADERFSLLREAVEDRIRERPRDYEVDRSAGDGLLEELGFGTYRVRCAPHDL